MQRVREQTLEIYAQLLGVRFTQLPDAPTWHEDVQLFAVHSTAPAAAAAAGGDTDTREEAGDTDTREEAGQLLGHFYLDLYSRPGKFGHQCVVPLSPSFRAEGQAGRATPAVAILGNMSQPRPVLRP